MPQSTMNGHNNDAGDCDEDESASDVGGKIVLSESRPLSNKTQKPEVGTAMW